MVDLPLEFFWTLGKKGEPKSYYNGRKGAWEDKVVVENGVSYYYLLGNLIATFDGEILELSTAGWDTLLTRDRLSSIIDYGNRYMRYNIPLDIRLRKVSKDDTTIYWIYNNRAVLPISYPLRVDVRTGTVLTPMVEVIPTFVIRPSRSKSRNAVISMRKIPGKYIIRDGTQYLQFFGRLFKLTYDGLWVEVAQQTTT